MSIKKTVAKCRKAHDADVARIYSLAEHGHMRFSECFALAPDELQQAYYASQRSLIEAEQAAVSGGKVWRTSTGGLMFYRQASKRRQKPA